ncbi:MAG: T9SS type A sorting domain-containing protein [Chitinophagales bacterium]|nr:T9SS type A sorting domain-containing protein [Chitinophagales bacterium]
MKNFLSITLMLLSIVMMAESSSAQTVNWAKTYGGPLKDKGRDIGIDQDGNLYVTGFFTDSAQFGSIVLHSVSEQVDEDIFIAKFDPDGNPIWAHSLGNGTSVHTDFPFGFTVNRDGMIALTGRCSNYIKFDKGDSIPVSGENNMFLCVFDTDGNLLWSKVGGILDESNPGTGSYMDDLGNIYITANYSGEGNIFNDVIIPDSISQHHMFVVCYDLNKNLKWLKVYDSETRLQSRDIVSDHNGGVLIGGNYSNTMVFGNYSFTSKGEDDGYILRLNSTGELIWAKTFGSTAAESYESAYSMNTDLFGNFYVVTTFQNDIDFDGNTVVTGLLHNIGIASYDLDGNFRWMNTIRGNKDSSDFSVFCLSTISENNVIVSGCFDGIDTVGGSIIIKPFGANPYIHDAFYAAFSPYDGEVQWAISTGGISSDSNYGLTGNNTGYAYGTGSYRNKGQFGPYLLISYGDADAFMLKLEEGIATSAESAPAVLPLMTFPNPTNGDLNIIIPAKVTTLKVVNALGQVVYSKYVKSDSNHFLNLDTYTNGIYYVELSGGSNKYASRVLVQR